MGHKRARKGKIAKPSHKQDLENNRVLIHEDHERADFKVRKTCCILFFVLVGIALSFHYSTDVVLAQVTIIPGTDTDDVDVDDDSTESEDEGVVDEEVVEEKGVNPFRWKAIHVRICCSFCANCYRSVSRKWFSRIY